MTKKKQSMPIVPQAVTKRPPEPKYTEATSESTAEAYRIYAELIKDVVIEYGERQDDKKVRNLYNMYRSLIQTFQSKKYPGDFEADLPTLGEGDFYEGITKLGHWCEDHAKEILAEPKVMEPPNLMAEKLGEQQTTEKTNRRCERSKPLMWKSWVSIFEVSPNTLRKWRKEKKYHFHQVGRRWTLPKHELPTEYLEKYRNATSQQSGKAQ